jgi:muconolactone delta-isomerase
VSPTLTQRTRRIAVKFLVTISNRPPTAGIVGAATYAVTAARALRQSGSEAAAPWNAKAQDESWVEFSDRSKAWFRENEQAGRVEAGYMFPEGGGIMIVDVASHEELHDLLFSNPGSVYLDHEVRPLLDFDTGMDKLASSFASGVGAIFARVAGLH